MSTTFFGAFAPRGRVRLAVYRHLTRSVQQPITFAEQFEVNKQAFKARRARECRKIPAAIVQLKTGMSW